MRLLISLCLLCFVYSCWTKPSTRRQSTYVNVVGNKPIYSPRSMTKTISYMDSALPVLVPGNIYCKGNYIYQLEIGKGIHIIDNSTPSQAHRIGFIMVNGSSQISIKDNYLYTNNYDDLVVLDISNSNTVTTVKRVAGAFPEGLENYYYNLPVESGYYECPRYNNDSMIVGWEKASIWTSCQK